jgi:hypothetical protein
VTAERPIILPVPWPTLAGALLLGAAFAAVLSGTLAQEGTARLRGTDLTESSDLLSLGRDRDPGRIVATPGPRVSAEARDRERLRPGERRTRRAMARRTRPPATAPVRLPVQTPLVARTVQGNVQPPLVGLPDPPSPPAPSRPRRRRTAEEDPYAQLGLRLGGITVLPAIQQGVGYDTNPNRLSGPHKGSTVLRTDAEVRLQSDWSAHALTGFLRGSYSAYPNVKGADRPEGEGRLALRVDVSRDTQAEIEGRFVLDTQRPGSPDLNAAVSERPLVATTGVAAGVTQRFNRLLVGLRGTIDRTVYEDAKLSSGVVLSQSDRDANQYGLRLRAGYELTPGVIPFVEALADTRVHDIPVDSAGFRRDSDGIGLRAGSTFEITRTLTGEVSGGIVKRSYEDPRLKDLRGPLVDAAVVWSATPLTTVRLRAQTQIDETTIANSSGALTQRATLEVQHDLRRNLSLTGLIGISETDYEGVKLTEETVTAGARLEYKLTRSVAVRASFIHERLKSTAPGSDYTANTYLLGLRFNP